jgi:hypothetical protein
MIFCLSGIQISITDRKICTGDSEKHVFILYFGHWAAVA